MVKLEQLENHEVEQLQKSILPSMQMDIRSILKSLGEVNDSQVAEQLIDLIDQGEYLIADKGYDSEKIREKAQFHGLKVIIPRKSNSKKDNEYFDPYLYKLRHLVKICLHV